MTPLRATFLCPSASHPIGGVLAVYEFANGLSRRGHAVHIAHLPGGPGSIDRIADLDWFGFEPAIVHSLHRSISPDEWPDADFVEISAPAFFSEATVFDPGTPLSARLGLPFLFVQAFRHLPPDAERRAFDKVGMKICIARWLVDALAATGVPRDRLAYVPYGLDHDVFRLTRSVEERPRRVAMLCHPHPVKGTKLGLAALEEVTRRDPQTRVVLFGTKRPVEDIPEGMSFVLSPPRDVLVDEIYNDSRVFVCPSLREGFGFCGIEAMAGGCALVTTSNGGSDDYAIDGETALVVEPRDAIVMADRIEELLDDADVRVRLATRGVAYVTRFDWDESARLLEEVLARYGAGG